MNSEETNRNPWNVTPTPPRSSPETASPWAVSPFQTSNPFKSPASPPRPVESEPEPDVVSSVVVEELPAFTSSTDSQSNNREEASVTSEVWTAEPVQNDGKNSAWTSSPVEKKAEENVEVQETMTESMSSDWTTTPLPENSSVSAWTTAPAQEKAIPESSDTVKHQHIDNVHNETASQDFISPANKVSTKEVDVEAANSDREEEVVTSSAWTTSVVEEKGDAATANTTMPVHEKPIDEKVIATAAAVEQEEAQDNATARIVEAQSPIGAQETSKLVESESEQAPSVIADDVLLASRAWNSSPVQDNDAFQEKIPTDQEIQASSSVKEVLEKTCDPIIDSPMVEEVSTSVWDTEPERNIAEEVAPTIVVEPGDEEPTVSSPWNTQPLQNETNIVESIKIKKDITDKPLQKSVIIQQKEVVKEMNANQTPVEEVEVMTHEEPKIDKKTIANAFDGVAGYKVDSVAKIKTIQKIEATTDAPGPCGACGLARCIIQ